MSTRDFIDAYIEVKMKDVTRYRASTHPWGLADGWLPFTPSPEVMDARHDE